jgi:hypothetical protein
MNWNSSEVSDAFRSPVSFQTASARSPEFPHKISHSRKYVSHMTNAEQLVAEALRNQIPVTGLAGVSITNVREKIRPTL